MKISAEKSGVDGIHNERPEDGSYNPARNLGFCAKIQHLQHKFEQQVTTRTMCSPVTVGFQEFMLFVLPDPGALNSCMHTIPEKHVGFALI